MNSKPPQFLDYQLLEDEDLKFKRSLQKSYNRAKSPGSRLRVKSARALSFIDKLKHNVYNGFTIKRIMKGLHAMASKDDAPKKAKTKEVASGFVREVVALWKLILTVAQFMASYILVPQDNLVFRVVGVTLAVSAAISAVSTYTRR